MRLRGSVVLLAVFSIFAIVQPGSMHGQCSNGDVKIIIPCSGGDYCTPTEVYAAQPGSRLGTVYTIVVCGNGCTGSTLYASGPCYAAALNTPDILRNLDRLSRKSPIPILVASCTGGLVEFHPSERMNAGPPRLLDVDARILKRSISLKNQKHSGE